jgi:hypothetical protein
MTSMSPWTPEMIGSLTPMQLLCMGTKRVPKLLRDSTDEPEHQISGKQLWDRYVQKASVD